MREKIALFCSLNEISNVESYQGFSDFITQQSCNNCIAYNTIDFLVQGIWDLYKGNIDDEQFFQIGDIGSEKLLKRARPHLDAVEKILTMVESHILYVIDNASKVTYTHVHGSRDTVEKKLAEKGSAIFSI